MAGLINLLKSYSTLASADASVLNDPAAEADRIFFDNNQPKIEQHISDSTKTKRNYKSLTSQDLEMIIWMTNPKKFEKEIMRHLDINLYFNSGAGLVLDKTKTNTGEMKRINGDWYVPSFQVGSGHGLYDKEHSADNHSTFTAFANQVNLTIEQTRKWIKDVKEVKDDELVTYVNSQGIMLDNNYAGKNKRKDVMPHKFIEPQVVYKYNHENGLMEYVGVKDMLENHIKFERGKSEPVPLDLLMKTTGFDYHGKNIVWKELTGKDKQINVLNGLMNDLKKEYAGKEKEFNKLKDQYNDLSKMLLDEEMSHERTRRGYSAGPLVEASYNGEKGNESVDVGYGLFSNFPGEFGNKITLEFIYTPRNGKNTESEPVILEDRASHPVLPITGVSKSTTTQTINKEAYDITGGLGFEVAKDFTLMLYGGMRNEFVNTSNSTLHETWFENNGVPYDLNSNIMESNSNNNQKHAKLGVGGKFHLGSANLKLGANYVTNGTWDVNAGVQVDVSTFFKQEPKYKYISK